MRRHAAKRVWLGLVATAAVVIAVLDVGGSSGATLARDSTRGGLVAPPQTRVSIGRRIWAFAPGSGGVTWVSEGPLPGGRDGCGVRVKTLRTGRTSIGPLPQRDCDSKLGGAKLGAGVVAWIKDYTCGNTECIWDLVTVAPAAHPARSAQSADFSCDPYNCDPPPAPLLAASAGVLVYTDGLGDNVYRIDNLGLLEGVGGGGFGAGPGGWSGAVQSLTVHGGVITTAAQVFDPGDGCGCLEAPSWSPDGSKIAYLDGGFDHEGYGGGSLAVMNADGSGRTDLSSAQLGYGPVFSPTWSPSGTQIAYAAPSSTRPYPETIFVANADGSGSIQLAQGASPAWSPDGSKIAFAALDNSGNAAIFTINPDGSGVQELGPGGEPAWSPDGTRIAFTGSSGKLEVMNADGSNPHALGTGTAGNEPSWSPDGSQIVFHNAAGLRIIGADGTGLRQLTNGPDEFPSWSPDGTTIVFASDRNDPAGPGYVDQIQPELYLVNPDGSNLRPLSFTQPAEWTNQTNVYSPSGRSLATLPPHAVLAGKIAAVGRVTGGVDKIALLKARTGAQVAVVRVGKARSGFVVVGGDTHWVVFRVGTAISALNVSTHAVVRLTTAAASPLDLSVAGRQVAWAENIDGHGRVRAVELPS